MTRTVPVRCLISLMTFALGLSIALPSHAVTVAEAVAAARNTQLPDIDGIMANHDGVLDAVGGGSTEGLDDVKNLWADGKGTLTGSAEATVIECRGKTDTTCRAIQVLDKGFPERPVIGEDVLAGRDEIVNNPTVTPDDNDTCKDVTIEADPVEVSSGRLVEREGLPHQPRRDRQGHGKVLCMRRRRRHVLRALLPHDRLRKARILRLDRAMLLRQGILRRLRYRHRRDLGRRTRDLLGRVHLHRRHDRNGQVQ